MNAHHEARAYPHDWLVIHHQLPPLLTLFVLVPALSKIALLSDKEERVEDEGSEFGLGDLNYQAFFSSAELGKVIWGAGQAFVFPTNTDDRWTMPFGG